MNLYPTTDDIARMKGTMTDKLPEELERAFDEQFPLKSEYWLLERHRNKLLAFTARCYREGAEQMRDVIMLAGVTIDDKDYIPWEDAERRSREFFEEDK